MVPMDEHIEDLKKGTYINRRNDFAIQKIRHAKDWSSIIYRHNLCPLENLHYHLGDSLFDALAVLIHFVICILK